MRSFALLSLAALLAACVFPAGTADAAPWMFGQSYYSHPPQVAQTPAPIDPRIIGGPLYSQPQGSYIRGAWRISRGNINVRGRLVDQTWQWESYIQGGSQN